MNTKLLRSIMVLNDDTGDSLAAALGISPQRFSAKLNGRRGAEFTQREIRAIKDRYSLTADEIDRIFFSLQVS